MRDLGVVGLVVALALGLVGLVVFAGGDRSVLVPPPEAAAETVVRALGMGRYELVAHYFAAGVQKRISPEDIEAAFEPVRARTGRPEQVITREAFRDGRHARVLATLQGRRGTAAMYVDLVREEGLWKVAVWPFDVVAR